MSAYITLQQYLTMMDYLKRRLELELLKDHIPAPNGTVQVPELLGTTLILMQSSYKFKLI